MDFFFYEKGMIKTMKKQLDLENEKINKLLLKFSLPCVISMLIASLYNIVDQIYIGHISGFDNIAGQNISILCNGATNVVYPFTLIALAICLLIGDGTASLFSLFCGKKDKDMADKTITNGIIMQVIALIVITILGLIFKDNILSIFGATTANYKYAETYYNIILLGIPAYMFGQGLNSVIRADGSPKFAMFAVTIGAIANIILDPIFIFTLDMKIAGAGIATIIGEYLTLIITLYYLIKKDKFKISKKDCQLDKNITKKISSLGISSLITQLSIVIIIAVSNNLINAINDPVYGTDIPLAVIGITMKVFGIVIGICIGIALGGQPIIGYNYGAGKKERVIETYQKILILCFTIGLIATIIFQFAPNLIINIFGTNNSALYKSYAIACFKIYMATILITCLVKATTVFLQSIGQSKKAMIISVLRDVILFVPAILLIGLITKNVKTMLYAPIVVDIITLIISVIIMKKVLSNLNETQTRVEIEEANKKNNNKAKIVITIAREYGSGGRYVGKLVAEALNINFYDKELIALTSKESYFSKDYITKNEEKINGIAYQNDDNLFLAQSKVIKEKANQESCVIVGRLANFILKGKRNTINIFLYSSEQDKINRAVKYYNIPKEKAEAEIKKINTNRSKYCKYYTNEEWNDAKNYDIALNVDSIGLEQTANIIINLAKSKMN